MRRAWEALMITTDKIRASSQAERTQPPSRVPLHGREATGLLE